MHKKVSAVFLSPLLFCIFPKEKYFLKMYLQDNFPSSKNDNPTIANINYQ